MIQNILFVCTGNQCRSPMAEAILKGMVRSDPALATEGIVVKSAGTVSFDGSPATNEATQVMKERGLDISPHRSRYVDTTIIDWADMVLAMGESHKQHIIRRFPDTEHKVYLLTEYVGEQVNIPDPIGNPSIVYRGCANQLASLLTKVVDNIKKARTG